MVVVVVVVPWVVRFYGVGWRDDELKSIAKETIITQLRCHPGETEGNPKTSASVFVTSRRACLLVVLQAACDYEAIAVYVDHSEWCHVT
jgi:hypothetical protein